MSIFSFLGKMVGGGIAETAKGVADVIDRFVETAEEKKAAEILLMKIQQKPDEWQAEINKIEASHRSVFIAGWRPFIGWVCGVGLGFHFVVFPLIEWIAALFNRVIPAPSIEVGALMTLVISLLGLTATRSYEKKHNLTK